MATINDPKLTPQEYLEAERVSETKHEYIGGRTKPMVGASMRHNQIVSNLIIAIGSRVDRKAFCIFPSDMRLLIEASGVFTYPDISIVSGKPELKYDKGDVLVNPVVLIEVLSESTEAYDRGKKFEEYRKIQTLREYVLVSQDRACIESFARQQDTWSLRTTASMEKEHRIDSVACNIALADIYANVTFDQSS